MSVRLIPDYTQSLLGEPLVVLSDPGGNVSLSQVHTPHLVTYKIDTSVSVEILTDDSVPILWEIHPRGPGQMTTSSVILPGKYYCVKKTPGLPTFVIRN